MAFFPACVAGVIFNKVFSVYGFSTFGNKKLIKQLQLANVVWTVENPLTSLLWETSYWTDVHNATDPYYCELHNCMFGGKRQKRTCLASNSSAVMSLNILCDGQHEHAPWSINNGVFDTALEAEYTQLLPKRWLQPSLNQLQVNTSCPMSLNMPKS